MNSGRIRVLFIDNFDSRKVLLSSFLVQFLILIEEFRIVKGVIDDEDNCTLSIL